MLAINGSFSLSTLLLCCFLPVDVDASWFRYVSLHPSISPRISLSLSRILISAAALSLHLAPLFSLLSSPSLSLVFCCCCSLLYCSSVSRPSFQSRFSLSFQIVRYICSNCMIHLSRSGREREARERQGGGKQSDDANGITGERGRSVSSVPFPLPAFPFFPLPPTTQPNPTLNTSRTPSSRLPLLSVLLSMDRGSSRLQHQQQAASPLTRRSALSLRDDFSSSSTTTAGGGHSLAHELVSAMEPSEGGARSLAEEFGIDLGDEEGGEEQGQSRFSGPSELVSWVVERWVEDGKGQQ